jgi:tRNA(Ile)-lysidine synthase
MRGARPDHALGALFLRALVGESSERCVVAVSGGSDSAALAGLAAEHVSGRSLALAHVNHGMRASATQDEAVVLALAARFGLPVRIARLSGARRDEATLRELRYAALIEVAGEFGAGCVMTGHTAQDQTETVLLALFRGTGPNGLRGMPPRRALAPGLALLRPLLRADRAALRHYCERARLPYAVDPSNLDESYRRNALRPRLAELRPFFPGLDRAVARCAEILRQGGLEDVKGGTA